ncbi:YokU family protein [Fictibacillus nanhaiensis]|uniref:YokU family protein n=1 Tax=Fictibacillus nanhaiensis TaxID=742169 RepID=UPI00203D1563|nr:YokU family protein [Fictibacillus nanhaiensis]MCM3730165.1 YokU family protein [Fictibacillus nanhaiensis]
MKCLWCENNNAEQTARTGYWELPDGSRAVEITVIPSVSCSSCGIEYQEDQVVDEIEDQLMLIDTKKMDSSISYSDLMNIPRFLKKNYFKL